MLEAALKYVLRTTIRFNRMNQLAERHPVMKPLTLSPEMAAALRTSGNRPIALIDPVSQTQYVLVDADTHARSSKALRQQEAIESIGRGLASERLPVAESNQRCREELQRQIQK